MTLNRLSLFAWLVSLESLDAQPGRQNALRVGFDLAALAVSDDLVPGDGQGHAQVARLLAELEADGWVTWEWVRLGGDPRPEQPPATMFDDQALQRVQNIRITPEGYAAFAAREALSRTSAPARGRPDASAEADRQARYDLFISHASEDKDAVARPLAEALTALGFAVWFDEERLEVGSSLRASIDAGLAESRYGVVVFSEAFFNKPWPPRELNGLFAREVAEEAEIILPLWHEIDAEFMSAKAPMLADRLALRSDIGIPQLAERLARRLRREQGQERLRARVSLAPPAPSAIASGAQASEAAVVLDGADQLAIQVRERVIAMLRAADHIGLRELIRHERRLFDDEVLAILQEAGDEFGNSAEPERLRPIGEKLWQLVDRRLASLLPLIEYQPEALADEVASLAALAGRSPPTRSPYSAWLDGPRWPVWLVTLILGTAAVALDRPEVAVSMWQQPAPHDDDRPLPAARLGGGAELGTALLRARQAQASAAVELWYPAFAVYDSDLLRTFYEEVMTGGDTPGAALGFLSRAGDFLWLCGALAGRDGVEVIRFWSASQVHPTLRRRLDAHAELRRRYAAALDIEPAALLGTLDEWLSKVSGPRI